MKGIAILKGFTVAGILVRHRVDETDEPVSLYPLRSNGIDPSYSSSETGIVVLEHIKPEDKKTRYELWKVIILKNQHPPT